MLSDVTTWEAMVRRTGGVSITVAAAAAMAHVEDVPVPSGDAPRIQSIQKTATVHKSRLPANPIGAAVVIGGVTWKVVELGDRSDDTGRELILRRG